MNPVSATPERSGSAEREISDPDRLNFARQAPDRIGLQSIALSGLAGFLAAWALAGCLPDLSLSACLILFVGFTAAPMVILSIFVNRTHLRPTSGLTAIPRPIDFRRCAIKLLGGAATLNILLFAYWVFPEYAKPRYAVLWETIALLAVPVLILSVGYVCWVDRRMAHPEDGYWHFGLLALGRWRSVDWEEIREHSLGWFIKGIFLPFMLSGVAEHAVLLLRNGWNGATFGDLYLTSISLIYCIDTVFGAVGYLLTLRILDAHIRSVHNTWPGWVATLICYVPFSQAVSSFLNYGKNIDWSEWLRSYPVLFISWGFAILFLHVIYLWSTISFGCRFSNLTNRGIIVDGPYRFLKHPAYLTKNLAWWLMYVPFAAHGSLSDNLRACVMLGLMNAIYFVRAKTEEFHLMGDPAYRLYSDSVDRYGIAAVLRRTMCRGWRRYVATSQCHKSGA